MKKDSFRFEVLNVIRVSSYEFLLHSSGFLLQTETEHCYFSQIPLSLRQTLKNDPTKNNYSHRRALLLW